MLPVITGSISAWRMEKVACSPRSSASSPSSGATRIRSISPDTRLWRAESRFIGDLDQIDALAKCLVQLGGVDANGRSALLSHDDGSERLGQLLIAETEEKENQERPQYQRDDQPGLSPDGNQLFAKESEAPGQ